MSDIIKEIRKLCLHQNFNLLKHLTDSQQALTHWHSNIISAKQAKVVLQKNQISLAHSNIKPAVNSLKSIEFRQLCQWIWVMKLQKKHAALTEVLCDYHSTVDLNHMIVQIKKEKTSSQILALIKHIIADHNWLTVNLFLLMIDESFTDIVKTMSHLCLQSEDKGQQNLTALKHNNHSSLMHSNSVDSNSLKPLFEFRTHIQST